MPTPIASSPGQDANSLPLARVMSERRFVSLYSIETLGLQIRRAGVAASADDVVRATFQSVDDHPGTVFSREATETEPGTYEVTLSSVETSSPGLYTVTWNYDLDGVSQIFVGYVEIGESSPEYDALDIGFKGIIESVYMRFADLFDSPSGGPHLQVYFQTRFGR